MINSQNKNTWIPFFFGIAACSFMPHWSYHYSRLETGSTFVVGNVHYSLLGSIFSIVFYTALILINLLSVSFSNLRFLAALFSGIIHIGPGSLCILRLSDSFPFELMGYSSPYPGSIREILMVFPFGIMCILFAINSRIKSEYKIYSNA